MHVFKNTGQIYGEIIKKRNRKQKRPTIDSGMESTDRCSKIMITDAFMKLEEIWRMSPKTRHPLKRDYNGNSRTEKT